MVRTMAKGVCALLNLIFPDDCRVCGAPLHNLSRVPICGACLTEPQPLVAEFFCSDCKTPFVNPAPLDEQGRCTLCRLGLQGFDAVYTYGSYEGPLRQLVHHFKFGGMRPLAATFGDMLIRALPRETSFDVIVPMPLHWFRRWQRGFNQSALLAKEISRRWHTPLADVARRGKRTAPQAGLTNSKRRLNVRGAFQVRGRLDGKHVLLVDDVLTTGATASACARALKRAGASRVTLLVVARTDRRAFVDVPALRAEGAHA